MTALAALLSGCARAVGWLATRLAPKPPDPLAGLQDFDHEVDGWYPQITDRS